jgi:hypothetical protein
VSVMGTSVLLSERVQYMGFGAACCSNDKFPGCDMQGRTTS